MRKILRETFFLLSIHIALVLSPLQGRADYFTALTGLTLPDKITGVEKVFNEQISKRDSIAVVKTLTNLTRTAEEKEDYVLAALSYDMLGRYYMDKDDLKTAAGYYEAGIGLSQEHGEKIIEAKVTHDFGYQSFMKQQYSKGFEYMLRGNEMMQDIGYARYPNIIRYLYEIAYGYYNMGYYEKAVVYLADGLRYRTQSSVYDIWVNNTLALAYQSQQMQDSALQYLNRTLVYARQRNDTIWIGIASGNIANILMSRKEYDKALPLLLLDYGASMHYGEWSSASNCMMSFAEISMEKGDLQLAHKQLDTARQLMLKNKGSNNKWIWKSTYYSVLSRLYYKEQNMTLAYQALDSTFIASRHLWSNDNIQMLNQVESKIALEKHLAELKLVESERSRLLIRRNAIIVVLLLLVIIVSQALRRMRLKQKKDKEIYELEVRRAEDEIQNARQLLASYTERLQTNSQIIQNFEAQMLQLKEESQSATEHDHEDKETVETFDKLNSFTILKEDDWKEFKSLFSKVYPDFFRKLHDKHPDLTQSETRFLALSKLGLSIKEMGHTLGVSPNSVRKTRERLRKKITITEQEFLKEIFPDN